MVQAKPSVNDAHYYSGRKDVQEQALRAALADSDDRDRSIVLRAQLAMLLRGQKKWDQAREALQIESRNLAGVSADTRTFVLAAEGALFLEEGKLDAAADTLHLVTDRFGKSSDSLRLRQYVSSGWKYAQVRASFGEHRDASRLLGRVQAVATDIGDLHGYCNALIAESHVAVSQGNYRRAVTALMWASHPPAVIGKDQPNPRFIAGELARAWAFLEWKYRIDKSKWLGYVHPMWALEFANQRLKQCMSFVMRVPFLNEFAISSPDQVAESIRHAEGMLRQGKGSRPKFSPDERERIFRIYDGLCALCGKKIDENDKWHVDHIVLHCVGHAPKRTARDAYLNYRPVHSRCNLVRGNADFWHLQESYLNNPTLWVEKTWRSVV